MKQEPVFKECNVCGRSLIREDEFACGMCAICANEEIDDATEDKIIQRDFRNQTDATNNP